MTHPNSDAYDHASRAQRQLALVPHDLVTADGTPSAHAVLMEAIAHALLAIDARLAELLALLAEEA